MTRIYYPSYTLSNKARTGTRSYSSPNVKFKKESSVIAKRFTFLIPMS